VTLSELMSEGIELEFSYYSTGSFYNCLALTTPVLPISLPS